LCKNGSVRKRVPVRTTQLFDGFVKDQVDKRVPSFEDPTNFD
jgi:hypothetical protein